MDAKIEIPDRPFKQAERRLEVFEEEANDRLWAKLKDGRRCVSLERTLLFGVELYDLLIDLDAEYREAVLVHGAVPSARLAKAVKELFAWWLRPCDGIEKGIQSFEAKHFTVKNAVEFRVRVAEAKWMVAPAKDAFNSEKVVALRDEAIDSARKGEVAALEE